MKKHWWYVDTGMYHKQLTVLCENEENAREKAYEKLIKMTYEEFNTYVSLNVSGFKNKFPF